MSIFGMSYGLMTDLGFKGSKGNDCYNQPLEPLKLLIALCTNYSIIRDIYTSH